MSSLGMSEVADLRNCRTRTRSTSAAGTSTTATTRSAAARATTTPTPTSCRSACTKVAGSHTHQGRLRHPPDQLRNPEHRQHPAATPATPPGRRASTTSANRPRGDGYASFLLGVVERFLELPAVPLVEAVLLRLLTSQDDWKVTRRLTLNLGFRWDLNDPQYEKWNRMNGLSIRRSPARSHRAVAANVSALQAAGRIPANLTAQYAALSNLKGGLTFAGVNGVGSSPYRAATRTTSNRASASPIRSATSWCCAAVSACTTRTRTTTTQQTNGFSTSTSIVNSNDGGRTPIPTSCPTRIRTAF